MPYDLVKASSQRPPPTDQASWPRTLVAGSESLLSITSRAAVVAMGRCKINHQAFGFHISKRTALMLLKLDWPEIGAGKIRTTVGADSSGLAGN